MSISKTRHILVDVARQLFAKNGVERTTMNDIAVASGKGRRTLYTYFNSKEEIYAAVIESELERLSAESVPLGELKDLAEDRMLLFDEQLMTFAMGNCIALEDTNGNRKLYKKRQEQKIDAVAAMMDAYIAYKLNKDAFE